LDNIHDNSSSLVQNPPVSVQNQYIQNMRGTNQRLQNYDESKTTDDRARMPQNMMMNTWTPNNKVIEEQFKKFAMMNQYKAMGINNLTSDMQKMLSNTLGSYNSQGRNHLNKDSKQSTKKNRSRQHSANPKLNHSKRRKSPNRGRNDNSFGFKTTKLSDENDTMFWNLMKNSLKSSKSKHKKKKSSANASKDRDSTGVHSIMPKNIANGNSVSGKQSRVSNSPKRGIKYSKMFGRGKGGSTRVSRKGSATNSNERGAYSTYVSQRVSPKPKKKLNAYESNLTNSHSFKFTNMMKDMGITFNYNNSHTR